MSRAAVVGLEVVTTVRRAAFTLDVALSAGPGEVLAVLGPNGAGKSTLLGVLSGLLPPDEGFVRVGDRVVTDTATGVAVPPHRRGVGLMAQQALLFPHLSALENVAFGPRAQGVPRRAAHERARALLAAVDAAALADRVVVLSDGRVAEQGPVREVLARPRSPFAARIAGLDLIAGVAEAGGLRTADGTLVSGRAESVAPGETAVAVFPPSAVAVFRRRPEGSPRNLLPVRLAAMEPRGDVVRLQGAARPGGPAWLDGLAADVTPAAVADLGAEPGSELWFAVKAAETTIYGT